VILDKLRYLGNLSVIQDATVLSINYTDVFNGFQERGRVDIQSLKYGLQVNVLLLRLGIVTVFSQHHQIAIIPFHDINIPFQTIGRPETYIVAAKTKGGKAICTT
jgi:hypothetical protein